MYFILDLVVFLCLVAISYGAFWISWFVTRRRLFKRITGIPEVQNLGDGRPRDERIKGTAVVCGGSIAGLLAARVCHDFFENVLIIEPEEWLSSEDATRRFSWEQSNKRTRIMQYYSLHGLQAFCYSGLLKLFPDLEEQCRYSGITVPPAEANVTLAGTYLRRPPIYDKDFPKTMEASRAGFETLIRRLVLGRGHYDDIKQIIGTVSGIVPSPDDRSRISKVLVRKDTSNSSTVLHEIDASLVVDCTGLSRAGFKWLSKAGYGTAETYPEGKRALTDLKISLDQKLHYCTLICDVPPSVLKALPLPSNTEENKRSNYAIIEDKPTEANGRRMFTIQRLDGPHVMLFVGQYTDASNVDYPSIAAVRSLLPHLITHTPIPEWVFRCVDMLEEAQVNVKYSHVRIPPTSYIRYHQGVNIPCNFVASGDSVMSVDPLFGQGSTKAMLGAILLHTALAKTGCSEKIPANFSEFYFKEHFYKMDRFWQATRSVAYGLPFTTPIPGEKLGVSGFTPWYSRKVRFLAIEDEDASIALWNSGMGFGTPVDIFHPLIFLKTLWKVVSDRMN
ncbi:hypothetical protein GYMLUDRAFT_592525 [Collybiopsis luxurians FD-317 M1]|uniref:Uncharacterized protein n=1 Tax=Collybiopsis luxurians FD-317 M1 TaxID=944289 RepID=A0A0D0BZD2_9AGAR|nr:hypothetical protein GYMLUDRAFT_592525 [Collybiopsis luxurians FD-317 M1]